MHNLDTAFGAFLDRLDRLGLAEDTLLVVIADHGDQFGEWGKVGHGESLHERVIHVPLALRWPGVVRPAHLTEPVQLIDVMPTLLDLLGLPTPAGVDGVSLVGAMTGKESLGRPAFAEQRSARGECYQLGLDANCRLDRLAVLEGRWKLVTSEVPNWTRLYDVESDSLAERDVAAEHPAVSARLAGLARQYRKAAQSGAATQGGEIDPDTRERLRALGYSENSSALEAEPPAR